MNSGMVVHGNAGCTSSRRHPRVRLNCIASIRRDKPLIYERLRIFISSRMQELAPERVAIRAALGQLCNQGCPRRRNRRDTRCCGKYPIRTLGRLGCGAIGIARWYREIAKGFRAADAVSQVAAAIESRSDHRDSRAPARHWLTASEGVKESNASVCGRTYFTRVA
jgi:hypothetical protein